MTNKECRILFSGPMVRAILDGRKTQTRRVMRIPAEFDAGTAWADPGIGCGGYLKALRGGGTVERIYPNYQVGDRLWVRETWGVNSGPGVRCTEAARPNVALPSGGWSPVVFRATTEGYAWGMYGPPKWRPAIHMPRTASRLTLTVTGVKVERLQEITEEDAVAEGAPCCAMDDDGNFYERLESGRFRCGFAGLWDSINGKREGFGWDANPWVVAVSFRSELRNIDAPADAVMKP